MRPAIGGHRSFVVRPGRIADVVAGASSETTVRRVWLDRSGDGEAVLMVHDSRAELVVVCPGAGERGLREARAAVDLEDARRLLAACARPVVEARRASIRVGERTWSIERFVGDLEGLAIASTTVDDGDPAPPLPDWVGNEVTGDARYRVARLRETPLAELTAPAFDPGARPVTVDGRAVALREIGPAFMYGAVAGDAGDRDLVWTRRDGRRWSRRPDASVRACDLVHGGSEDG